MVRLRWGVAALATVLVAAVGLFTFTHRSTTPDPASFGSGSQNAADLAATRSMLAGLAVPAGTTRDPYATACGGAAVVCLAGALPTRTLLTTVTAQLKAAGATVLTHTCQDNTGCSALYDFRGVHIGADAGASGAPGATATTHLALRVSNPAAAPRVPDRTGMLAVSSKPFGSWAGANPFPAAWHVAAACSKPVTGGCNQFRNDWKTPTSVASGLSQAFAAVRESLTAAGFRVDNAICYPASSVRLGQCLIAGMRFRTLGGEDGEVVSASLQSTDADHVTARVSVSAL